MSTVVELNGARRPAVNIELELEMLGLFELNELSDANHIARVISEAAERATKLTGAFREQFVTRAIESLTAQNVPGGPKAFRAEVATAAKSSKRRAKANGDEAWREELIYSDNGSPVRGVANVLTVLVRHPDWIGVLALDAFRECTVKLRPPPVRPQDGDSKPGEWCEDDSTRAATWFATHVGFEPSVAHVEQAVAAAAARNVIHPVRDYVRAQVWDGKPRLDGFLPTYFGAADTPYSRAIGARWVMSAVARVFEPGCQADCTLIAEGAQGTGKSTGFEALAGKDNFADTGMIIGDKDSYQVLRGKWIYELGELDAFKGREASRIKAFLSARVDNYRPSFARRNRDFHRQNVFCGSTNEVEYLNDHTGNRRFWPFRCGVVQVDAIRRDRDQLWAEAYVRYSAGEPWHVDTPELRALCEAEQADREVDDPWTNIVARWLSEQALRREINPADGVAISTIMSGALTLSAHDMHHAQVTRLGHVLRVLGWEPRQVRREGGRTRLYFPMSQPAQPDSKSGCDENLPRKQGDTYPSQVSHPHNNLPVCARAPAHAGGEQMLLGRDGCDAVTPEAIDALERAAIEAEGRGERC